jgi:hypothetical protein
MSKDPNGLPHNVETHPMAVARAAVHASEQIKDSRHLVPGYADTGVIDFDTDAVAGRTAADENATAWVRVFDRVTHQISQDRTEKQPIALNGGAGRNHTQLDSLSQSFELVLASNLLKQVHELQWHRLHALRIAETKCRKKLIELSGQPIDRTLTGSQQAKLRFGPNAETKQFVRALDRLERLTQIMTSDRKQYGPVIRNLLRFQLRTRTPGKGLRRPSRGM